MWLFRELREWIIPNAVDGVKPTAIQSSIPKPDRHSKSNFNFKRITKENTVPITVDRLIKAINAM